MDKVSWWFQTKQTIDISLNDHEVFNLLRSLQIKGIVRKNIHKAKPFNIMYNTSSKQTNKQTKVCKTKLHVMQGSMS